MPIDDHVTKDERVMPPGRYFVGDIMLACRLSQVDTVFNSITILSEDTTAFAVRTRFEEGVFYDSDDNKYIVRNGFIGVISDDSWQAPQHELSEWGNIVEITEPTKFSYDGCMAFFGNISIDLDEERGYEWVRPIEQRLREEEND